MFTLVVMQIFTRNIITAMTKSSIFSAHIKWLEDKPPAHSMVQWYHVVVCLPALRGTRSHEVLQVQSLSSDQRLQLMVADLLELQPLLVSD
jgi:hypothetical protein